jgi:hypothetical protein
MCDYLNEYLLPRFRAYLKRNGWTASELATHCLTAALYASFNGQVPIESLSSSATADSAPKAIGTIPRTDKPASLLDR